MTDWLSSMQQTFEYYTVDPGTWKDDKKLDNVKSCTISRDLGTETLGSATIEVTESVGECYISESSCRYLEIGVVSHYKVFHDALACTHNVHWVGSLIG